MFAQAIRPPTVPDGSSRLRLAAMATHNAAELEWAAGQTRRRRARGRRARPARRRRSTAACSTTRVPPSRGLFVTGTDTEVGKTVVASAIAATLAAQGSASRVFKPVVTGLADPETRRPTTSGCARPRGSPQSPGTWPPTGSSRRFAAPRRGRAGERGRAALLRAAAHRAAVGGDVLVAEGVGGLMVPLSGDYLVRDLAADLGLPVVIAARPGSARSATRCMTSSARAPPASRGAVVLTPGPREPSEMERSNRETIARLGRVEVETLPMLAVRSIGPQRSMPVELPARAPGVGLAAGRGAPPPDQ